MIRVRSARLADLPGVAMVLEDAFNDKMRVIFGKQPEKTRALLENIYTGPVQRGYDGVLVAEQDGRIVGTLLIEPMHHTPQENRVFVHIATRELGMPRVFMASFLLWLVGHKPEPGEAYISDVGVATDSQGQGIGQELLYYAEQWALNRPCERLTLWVAATNERALYVYEKAGFSVKRTRSSWLTRLAFGIRHWYFMEKPLNSSPDETGYFG
jgi:ribosomal protein S18 acetylase RimI-like enzyme